MNDLLKEYGCIKIACNRYLHEISYPMFCILRGNEYDTNKPISFKQVLDYLHYIGELRTVVVLDSFDLGYYGYIDNDDLANYEVNHDIISCFRE